MSYYFKNLSHNMLTCYCMCCLLFPALYCAYMLYYAFSAVMGSAATPDLKLQPVMNRFSSSMILFFFPHIVDGQPQAEELPAHSNQVLPPWHECKKSNKSKHPLNIAEW